MALEAIIRDKRAEIDAAMALHPLVHFEQRVLPSDRSFFQALAPGRTRYILECKKASPSQGLIRPDFDVAKITRAYAPFADAISVLTDQKYFQGELGFMRIARENAPCPILNKDFIIDPYQIVRARCSGADAVLLMLSVLDDATYLACRVTAERLNMGYLTEVHDEAECRRALALKAPLIGINNRDLKTLKVDIKQTEKLVDLIPADRCLISESGISSHADILRLRPFVHGFLVGTQLMRQPDLDQAIRRLIFGEVKICGLRDAETARSAFAAGASWGGLIFYPKSPRAVSVHSAHTFRFEVPGLRWVGVFVDQTLDEIADIAQQLQLSAVQIHRALAAKDVAILRQQLPPETEIWLALHPQDAEPEQFELTVDRWVLDRRKSGDPQKQAPFEWKAWSSIKPANQLVLAGGLDPKNVALARSMGLGILDVNSGVETQPGLKSDSLIQNCFAALRGQGKEEASA